MVVFWNKLEIKFVEGENPVISPELISNPKGVLVGKSLRFFDEGAGCEVGVSGSFDVCMSKGREFFEDYDPEYFKDLLYSEVSKEVKKAEEEISRLKKYSFAGRAKDHKDKLVLSREVKARRNGSFDQSFYNMVFFKNLIAFECLLEGDISSYDIGSRQDRKNFTKLLKYVETIDGGNLAEGLNVSYDTIRVKGNSLKKSLERTLEIYEFMR